MTLKPSSLNLSSIMREVIFGAEDGMVSTLGAISGIAIGSQDHKAVVLAGVVIIAVESISMAIGSYLSNSASVEANQKVIHDEISELEKFPEKERRELYRLFMRDGWNKHMAYKMAKTASLNHIIMLKEHEYRELGIFPYRKESPVLDAISMFLSYIAGGFTALTAYFFLPLSQAFIVSVLTTLCGLFLLGMLTTKYTSTTLLKAGVRTMVLGTIAFVVGTVIGKISAIIK